MSETIAAGLTERASMGAFIESGAILSVVVKRVPQHSHWGRRTLTCLSGTEWITEVDDPQFGQYT